MASQSELTFDCKPHINSYNVNNTNTMNTTDHVVVDQIQKLEDFLSRLQQERLKVDAFKRELPLSIHLLTNAMETSKQQLQTYRRNYQGPQQPAVEAFIPLRQSKSDELTRTTTENKISNMSDHCKANWMTSVQLWSQQSTTIQSPNKETDQISTFNIITSPNRSSDADKQRSGGAFHPFAKEKISCPNPIRAVPRLNLGSTAAADDDDKKCIETNHGDGIASSTCLSSSRDDYNNPRELGESSSVAVSKANQGEIIIPTNHNSQTTTTTTTSGSADTTTTTSQTHRKTRRCWSPDLHRRFVNALQMIGGSQVATPKQIREVMKVDGLSNDEVKSHLQQKYRLHTRRPSPTPQAAATPTPQLLVLGGIWVPPEYATATAVGGTTLYGAHHASAAHYPLPQEYYYSAAAEPPQLQTQAPHQLHMYKPSPQIQRSPESDLGNNNGVQSESIEDGKSESNNSWKAESGGERKGLVVLREDGEENNGSDITLKF